MADIDTIRLEGRFSLTYNGTVIRPDPGSTWLIKPEMGEAALRTAVPPEIKAVVEKRVWSDSQGYVVGSIVGDGNGGITGYGPRGVDLENLHSTAITPRIALGRTIWKLVPDSVTYTIPAALAGTADDVVRENPHQASALVLTPGQVNDLAFARTLNASTGELVLAGATGVSVIDFERTSATKGRFILDNQTHTSEFDLAQNAPADGDDQSFSDLVRYASQTRDALKEGAQDPTPGTFGGTLMQTYVQDDGQVNAKDRRLGTWRSRQSVINALDAAEYAGTGTVVYFPASTGAYDVGDGLSLAGRSVQIRGAGAYMNTAFYYFGTVFHATTQDGPVLNFDGWNPPASFTGKAIHSGFQVRGSNLPDAAKNNAGIRVKILGSTTFRDIAISETGGPCLQGTPNPGDAQYLSNFDNLTLNTPLLPKTNDVPWIDMDEANGCLFNHIGFRHVAVGESVGRSGAVFIRSNNTYASGATVFRDCWMENLHASDLGTLVNIQGNQHEHRSWRFPDCYKEPGARETSVFRLLTPVVGDSGGNVIDGFIPGRDPDFPGLSIDWGVDVRQSYNHISGVKGRNGYNVVIRGVNTPAPVGAMADNIHTATYLGGAMAYADAPAVVDQTNATGFYQNRHIDGSTGTIKGFTLQ